MTGTFQQDKKLQQNDTLSLPVLFKTNKRNIKSQLKISQLSINNTFIVHDNIEKGKRIRATLLIKNKSSFFLKSSQFLAVLTFIHPAYTKRSTVAPQFKRSHFPPVDFLQDQQSASYVAIGNTNACRYRSCNVLKWTCLSRYCLAKQLLSLPLQYIILLLWCLLLM